MNEKFKNKNRKSPRLQTWDYRWQGSYFITICTKNREHYFGEIIDSEMILSNIGVIADIFWHEIKNHAKNIELGEFIVMPNHVHGILIIKDFDEVGTGHALSLPNPHALSLQGQQRFQNIGKNSVSSIIGSYKSAVSKHAHRLGYDFEWQDRFYDNIIRDDKALQTITDYIYHNPSRWKEDKFYL